MDLGAYANIEDLDEIAKKNGIDCPRLRGYRLMNDEEPMELKEFMGEDFEHECCEQLCTSDPFWNPYAIAYEYSWWTDRLRKYYCPEKTIRWDRIHGWKRKVLKTYIHNEKQKCKKQCDVWNKYVGRDDILYIHSRIGGGNWSIYKDQVIHQPWFLEKVDDAFDSTYCDIYAKITK